MKNKKNIDSESPFHDARLKKQGTGGVGTRSGTVKTPPLVRLGFIWEKSHLVSLYEYETVRLIIYLKSHSPLRIENVMRRLIIPQDHN